MKLCNDTILQQRAALEAKGYALPTFDRAAVTANTAARPEWVHFGAGNIFRAFIANLNQSLLNAGLMDTGIVVAEGFDAEILDALQGVKLTQDEIRRGACGVQPPSWTRVSRIPAL